MGNATYLDFILIGTFDIPSVIMIMLQHTQQERQGVS